MPKRLTTAQRAYAQARAGGESQLASYRSAYPTSRESDATARSNAKRLEAKPDLRMLIREMEQAVLSAAAAEIAVTKAVVMKELWDNSQRAKQAVPVIGPNGKPTGMFAANIAASNAALIALGKEIGMFRDKPKGEDPLDAILAGMTHEQLVRLKSVLEAAAEEESSVVPIATRRRQ